jgi:hypothetical protein
VQKSCSCAGQQGRVHAKRGLLAGREVNDGQKANMEAHCLQEVDVTNGGEAGGWARGESGLGRATDARRGLQARNHHIGSWTASDESLGAAGADHRLEPLQELLGRWHRDSRGGGPLHGGVSQVGEIGSSEQR